MSIVQLQIDHEHFLVIVLVVQHQKQRRGRGAHQAFLVAFVKHIHIKTRPLATHLQIETITEHRFLCEYSLVIIQAACMTHRSYTTTQYIHSSSEWIAGKVWTLLLLLFVALHPASYSQLCLCVDECEQTFPRAEKQKASVLPFSALETHCGCGGVAWWLLLCPGSRHMLLSLQKKKNPNKPKSLKLTQNSTFLQTDWRTVVFCFFFYLSFAVKAVKVILSIKTEEISVAQN